jgi:hypothetical protein
MASPGDPNVTAMIQMPGIAARGEGPEERTARSHLRPGCESIGQIDASVEPVDRSVDECKDGIEGCSAATSYGLRLPAVVGIIPLHFGVTLYDMDVGPRTVDRIDLREEAMKFGIGDGAGSIDGHQ